MSIVRNLLWSLARRAAADPRVRRKAGQAFVAVDRRMDRAADKFVKVATAKDPAREMGRAFGRLLDGEEPPKR